MRIFNKRAGAALIGRMGAASALLMTVGIQAAHATDAADLANGATSQLGAFGTLVVSGAFLAGLLSVCWGVWTFRVAHKSEGRDAKFSHGAMYLLVGAGLLALPALAGVSVSTLFNGGTASAPTQQSITVGN